MADLRLLFFRFLSKQKAEASTLHPEQPYCYMPQTKISKKQPQINTMQTF